MFCNGMEFNVHCLEPNRRIYQFKFVGPVPQPRDHSAVHTELHRGGLVGLLGSGASNYSGSP